MSITTAEKIMLCASLTGFSGGLIYVGISLYLAYTKIDEMLEHLKNCPAVTIRIPFKNGGPWGRLFLLGGVVGVLVMPRVFLRDGGADPEDLKRFPVELKRKLLLLNKFGLGCLSLLAVLSLIVALDLV